LFAGDGAKVAWGAKQRNLILIASLWSFLSSKALHPLAKIVYELTKSNISINIFKIAPKVYFDCIIYEQRKQTMLCSVCWKLN
jgi:hypothetical protein